jgi:Fe-S cluster assembly protein SufD
MTAPTLAPPHDWAVVPEAAGRWVFVDGRFDAAASSAAPPAAGLTVGPTTDCALLRVGRGVLLDGPLHVVFVSTGAGGSFPLLRLVAEPGSAVTLIETHLGRGGANADAVTTVLVESGASVRHVRLQLADDPARHVGRLEADLSAHSRYALWAVTLGGAESRLSLAVTLEGEGAEARLDGLTHVAGGERSETRSEIRHQAPNGRSRQLQKVLADDRARATFHGRIEVARGAQATDAAQASRALLLGAEARVEARPELMIFSDDVKCAHGATVGQLDAESSFYLQSRGLAEAEARALLTAAFAAEAIAHLPVPSLRQALHHELRRRVAGKEHP